MTAEWYYVGHYGQLGPLTLDDMESLIRDEVILRETMVWKPGLANWVPAIQAIELGPLFIPANPNVPPTYQPNTTPPPYIPGGNTVPAAPDPAANFGAPTAWNTPNYTYPVAPTYVQIHNYSNGMSDRSRVLAGILQLILPGVGRMYLGYSAIGVIQLLLFPCGVGAVWSFIDGIVILVGGVRLDGYGRTLNP